MTKARYGIQVLVPIGVLLGEARVKVWQDLKPSGDHPPYRYDTYEEAASMSRMCYPEHQDIVRIIEVNE
jgi:hypothetical protein